MLIGRLGLESARIPQADRHGLVWLGRGNLFVENGTVVFATPGYDDLKAGRYTLPFQMVSCILLQPGTSVSHDVLRLLARHDVGLVAVGSHGIRCYASMPFGPDQSARARRHALMWTDPDQRMRLIRLMYAWRIGEVVAVADLDALRGIEGARVKEAYRQVAKQFGIPWRRREYDRDNPQVPDLPNQAINHASSALRAAAMIAVSVCGAIPQLGFIHEDSGIAFPLDIADLFRESILLPVAFGAVKRVMEDGGRSLEREVREGAGRTFRNQLVIPKMIDRIKDLLDAYDGHSNQ